MLDMPLLSQEKKDSFTLITLSAPYLDKIFKSSLIIPKVTAIHLCLILMRCHAHMLLPQMFFFKDNHPNFLHKLILT